MDELFQIEEFLGGALEYVPLDDGDLAEAHRGLPEISSKPETLSFTHIEPLFDLGIDPSKGSFGEEWMEQDIHDFSIMPQDLEDYDFNKAPTFTIPTSGPAPVEVKDQFENMGHSLFDDEFLLSLHQDSSKLDTPPSTPLTPPQIEVPLPQIEVKPEIIFDEADIDHSTLPVLDNAEFIRSPLSPDDVENVLSAGSLSNSPAPTPSPALSPSSATVDTALLYSDDGSWSFNSSELYKVVKNTEKSRPTPYSRPPKASKSSSKSKGRKQTASISPDPSELELELMSKKDRKKLQNKNAAIRYRMKKKLETDEKMGEVEELESINVGLREKCESVEREVKYMKELINDIRKARGQPPLSLSQHSLLAHQK